MAKFIIGSEYTDPHIGRTFTVTARSRCFVTVTDGENEGRFKIQYFSKILKSGERIKQNEALVFGYGDGTARIDA